MLDAVRDRGQVAEEDFPKVFGRISFFVNAGVRFIEEHAKLRAMGILWEELGRERYGVTDPKYLRMRYGVQVNSLGLTEAQPENNVPRIVLEALAVTLGRDARARAIQLPAWNEALGLPRPWDQQWSLRIQQILANETDLLEYPDIFEGSKVMEGLVEELIEGARDEIAVVAEHGGAITIEAVAYMKARLVESHRERIARIEAGELKVIGQNSFTETEDSPLTVGEDGGILTPDPEVERERIEALEQWKAERDGDAVEPALEDAGRGGRRRAVNLMPATIEAAKAGATTGEWSETLREVFGAYRGPTGLDGSAAGGDAELLAEVREKVSERRRPDRPPDPDPRRQARPRRPLQRRRADRRPRPRRRHGGHLPGHPPDPGGDRGIGGAGGRRRGRPLDPLRLPPRARPAGGRADPRGRASTPR